MEGEYMIVYLQSFEYDCTYSFTYTDVIRLDEESVDYQLPTNHISTACIVIYLILLYLMYDTISNTTVPIDSKSGQHNKKPHKYSCEVAFLFIYEGILYLGIFGW